MTKKKPERKKPERKSQKERFIDAAVELDADLSGSKFEQAFQKIVPPKPPIRKKLV